MKGECRHLLYMRHRHASIAMPCGERAGGANNHQVGA
jgi:hypothetical protein